MWKHRIPLFLLLVWLLPALACNMPTRPGVNPTAVARSVQQTLAAQDFPPIASTVPVQAPTSDISITATPEEGALPVVTVTDENLSPTPTPVAGAFQYTIQPGDMALGLAGRFGVPLEQILDPSQSNPKAYLPVGKRMNIPDQLGELRFRGTLLPDSEMVYSPSTVGFSVQDFVEQAHGFLSTYSEEVDGVSLTGAQIIERAASETSINPRLLLAMLEYRSHWVFGQPADPKKIDYPIGFYAGDIKGLYPEISLTSHMLMTGYYGWRTGKVTTLEYADGEKIRLDPTLNAGTVALQNLFSKFYLPEDMQKLLYGPHNFLEKYSAEFGDPWQRDEALGPLLPVNLAQPELELPFAPGETWTLTGGPHAAWGVGSIWASLDFAPADEKKGCTVSQYWATAVAPGLVTRSENGVVALDLDMDGNEQTGWAFIYLHIAKQDRIPVGTRVKTGDRIGHPSCEGGVATGRHEHVSRKYNGEWMAADGPVPFVLSGWQAFAAANEYSGVLRKGDETVTSRVDNAQTSLLER